MYLHSSYNLRYLFRSYSFQVLTKLTRFQKTLLRKNNLNWRNDNFRKTTVMFQLSFYWLTITIYYEILITSLNKAIVCLNMCICLCFPLIHALISKKPIFIYLIKHSDFFLEPVY